MSHKNKDLQNQLITEQLSKTQLAVNTLQALHLTVLSIDKIGERPRIRILPGKGCEQLRTGWITRSIKNGLRFTEKVALVAECQVSWEERS
ncbi:hypothetical protein [Marinobacterium stanieri]|uniref:Uncharacterized protein n=1 Tax=Marinobacterium stanieri TaxID=49186 RepID=A0A1N6RN60_9GAMM|nr:hypothetical protein [Marinobacterium stanieri]SIQ30255.1 hypothetical protein SAMN05421647_103428 [Marinobacterium stanieri]